MSPRVLALALLVGCGSAPEPKAEPAPEPEVVKTEAVVAAPTEPGATPEPGAPVSIELQYVGVGGLHQRWFGDSGIATDLSVALGACMTGRAVIKISYDEEVRIGRIRLILDGDQTTCKPRRTGSAVDMAPLEPLGRALAAYRDTVAGRFDFRVASFRVELEMLEGTNGCVLTLGGQFPPDGSSWAHCIELGGEEVCTGPKREGTPKPTFSEESHARYLAACFDVR